jgi:hypothetical protein
MCQVSVHTNHNNTNINHSPFNPETSTHSDDNDNKMEMYALAREDTHMQSNITVDTHMQCNITVELTHKPSLDIQR